MQSAQSQYRNTQEDIEEVLGNVKTTQYTYSRSTFTSVPARKSDFKKTGLPLVISAVILPSEEEEVKGIDSAPRCTSCKAYLNPYCEVVPPGYKWRCSICKSINDVQSPLHSYGASLRVFSPGENAQNNRRASSNPILVDNIIEFPSGTEKSIPPPPVYLFAVECTGESIERGVISAVLSSIPKALENLNDPYDRAEIGILLFGTTVQMIRLNEEKLTIDTINEIDSMLPVLLDTEYIVPLKKIRDRIDSLMVLVEQQIMSTNKETQNDFGLVLKVTKGLLQRGGALYAFLSTMPSIREGKIPGPSPELNPKVSFYTRIADALLSSSVSVNLFVLTSKSVEIPALLPVVERTGGSLRYYPAFLGTHPSEAQALTTDLSQHLALGLKTNVYCRVRVSDGVTITKYWGVSIQDEDLIRLSTLEKGKSFSFELEYDDDLIMEGISIQVASIFNSPTGTRMVRVINFYVAVGPTAIDPQAVVHAIALKATDSECKDKGSGVNTVLKLATNALICTGIQGNMQVFPRLIFGLVKNKVFKSISSDLKGVILNALRTGTFKMVDSVIYPTLVRLDTAMESTKTTDEIVLPSPIKLSSGMIDVSGVYLLDTGVVAYIFVGDASRCTLFTDKEGRFTIPDTPEYSYIRLVVKYLVDGRATDPIIYVIQQTGHQFLLDGFQGMLLEDGPSPVALSYNEFLNRFLSKGYIK
ncbi:protein transport protein SEC24 [Nematocida sp. AWRm80]|nr:protein transport protein SEC24 [Nematocida sp. AWRm80]